MIPVLAFPQIETQNSQHSSRPPQGELVNPDHRNRGLKKSTPCISDCKKQLTRQMTFRRANPAGNLRADRYLENTHCEGSVLLQLVVGAVLGLGGLPRQPVFVPPAAHVLERKTAPSQEPGQ